MHPSRIDMPQDRRAALVQLLNHRLSDLIDLHLQAKQAHWNVRGPNFIALHELFDKVAEVADEHTDEVAERIAQLGGIAEGTVQAVHGRTHLHDYPLTIVSGHEHVEALSSALAKLAQLAREAIDKSTELGDVDTADLFTGVSRDIDKYLWFVEAHLHSDR